ncbi:hypothetical protein ACFL3E_00215 [Patescibacteria group bacterium]
MNPMTGYMTWEMSPDGCKNGDRPYVRVCTSGDSYRDSGVVFITGYDDDFGHELFWLERPLYVRNIREGRNYCRTRRLQQTYLSPLYPEQEVRTIWVAMDPVSSRGAEWGETFYFSLYWRVQEPIADEPDSGGDGDGGKG